MIDFINNIDADILLFIQNYIRTPFLNTVMKVITSLGNAGILWIVLAVLFLCMKKYRKTGAMMGLALVFGLVITNMLLKNAVARIRPYEVIEGLNCIIKHPSDWSFPSGHSTSSIAASVVMLKTMPKKIGIPALILGIIISLSRLYVGVHYPSDVVCGILIGLVCALVSVYIVNKRIEAYKIKHQK